MFKSFIFETYNNTDFLITEGEKDGYIFYVYDGDNFEMVENSDLDDYDEVKCNAILDPNIIGYTGSAILFNKKDFKKLIKLVDDFYDENDENDNLTNREFYDYAKKFVKDLYYFDSRKLNYVTDVIKVVGSKFMSTDNFYEIEKAEQFDIKLSGPEITVLENADVTNAYYLGKPTKTIKNITDNYGDDADKIEIRPVKEVGFDSKGCLKPTKFAKMYGVVMYYGLYTILCGLFENEVDATSYIEDMKEYGFSYFRNKKYPMQ